MAKQRTTTTDHLGQPVTIGDEIVTITPMYRGLLKGKVRSITATGMVNYSRWDHDIKDFVISTRRAETFVRVPKQDEIAVQRILMEHILEDLVELKADPGLIEDVQLYLEASK